MTNDRAAKAVRIKAMSAVSGLLLMGMLIGALGMRSWDQHVQAGNAETHSKSGRGGNDVHTPGGFRDKMLERLNSQLTLDADQTAKIKQIISSTSQQMVTLREESRPKFLEIRERSRDQIRAVLTPEQKVKFEELIKQQQDTPHRENGKGEGQQLR